MDWADWFAGPHCRACGSRAAFDALACAECGRELSALPPDRLESLEPTRILPLDPLPETTAPGATPLLHSDWLAEESGLDAVYVKDEGRNPTGHVSDRDMALALAAADHLAIDSVSLASPGRSGVAAAAAAASRGITASVYVPSRAPFPTKAMINVHGGDMTVVGGRYPDAAGAMDEGDGWSVDPFENPYARTARVTLYLELLADLDGRAPDVLVCPAGTGAGITALADIALACRDAGLVDAIPRIVAAQPAGCAPIVDALVRDADDPAAIETPDSIVGELEIPSPAGGAAAIESVRATGGEGIAVPDPAALEAAVTLADTDGMSASLAGGVAAAAATDLRVADPGDTVVVLNPGAGGLDADVLRSHLMGQGI